jgi:hypothetical protein
MAVIDESPHYNALFKEHEKDRLTKGFLRALQRVDPFHVIVLTVDDVPGGGLISGPETGAIFRYWSWIFPRTARPVSACTACGCSTSTGTTASSTRPSPSCGRRTRSPSPCSAATATSRRLLLRQHIFGQDYVVMEKFYTKVTEGYDRGMSMGRIARFKARVDTLLGR